MRKNTLLTAAISSALLVPLSSSAADDIEQFVNVGDATSSSIHNQQGAAQPLFETGGNSPAYRFDQNTAVKVAGLSSDVTLGTPFADILFGGAITVPTEINTGTGQYLATMYTIDGDIVQDFEIKFTLDNGAQFAEKPLIGVRDVVEPSVTVDSFSAAASTVTLSGASGFTVGTVFKFESDAGVYVVKSCASCDTATGVATVTLWRLGGAPSAVVTPVGSVAKGDGVLKGSNPIAQVYNPYVGSLAAAPNFGASPIEVSLAGNNTGLLQTGWTYTCSQDAGGIVGGVSLSKPLFKLDSIKGTAVATAAVMVVSLVTDSPSYTAGTAGNCTGSGGIYRVHVKEDTIIHVTQGSAAAALNTKFVTGSAQPYRFSGFTAPGVGTAPGEAFASGIEYGGTAIYPDHTDHSFTANAPPTTGNLVNTIQITPPLDEAIAGHSQCGVGPGNMEYIYEDSFSAGAEWTTDTLVASDLKAWPVATLSAGNTVATFKMPAGDKDPNDLNLQTADQIMLFYRMNNLGALAETGEKVNMSVKLSTGGSVDKLVNPERTITVARSVTALETDIVPTVGNVKISVSASEKEFTGEALSTDHEEAFYDQNRAYIGLVKISKPSDVPAAYLQDASSDFNFEAATASESKFEITGGQFQASAASPGKVVIGGSAGDINADQVTVDGDGFWTATWNLDGTELQSIMDVAGGAKILMQVDGSSIINSVENPPIGRLEINFDDTFMHDELLEDKELKRIPKDGSVCTVYNVPPPTGGVAGADILNLRITNDSAATGSVTGELFGEDGALLSGENGIILAEVLEKGKTLHLTSDEIAQLAGVTTWTGRAILKVRTIGFSQVEILAMLRQQGVANAPLSNVSVGADGKACSDF